MAFHEGQPVIWRYQRFKPVRRVYHIAAEIVYSGPLRARIRIVLSSGETVLRWVKPDILFPWTPDAVTDPYPCN